MVDEAHATGALGPGGRGAVAAAGLSGEVDVVVGTLGKALGCYGAYVCAARRDRRAAASTPRGRSSSRPRPPPPVGRRGARGARRCSSGARAWSSSCAATRATLREALAAEGLGRGGSRTQIVPVDGRRRRRRRWRSASGRSSGGVFAQAIRPPTVPEGTSRLRLTVMATHRADELRAAARVIGDAARELGIATAAGAADRRRSRRAA